ncbi:nicotinate-nucleotide adenylyltransferase [Candidatus Methylocalor cossyra]|uniref:Probable nicotinate-nucleotide adenylyltransferase n=1 Tax=Candidatus Methylocalor cossyra TaxID=3108543 RepID=A0ABM9NIA8_9GAMM
MIGLYGGTFDPVHYGHLRTALEVKEAVGLAEVRFIPCREPPHRRAPAASPEQRLALLRAALADGEPGFRIDTRELERPGPSYTADTLMSLREELGEAPLALIVGLDAFLELHHWHRWRELFERAHLLVMQRPGPEPELPAELDAALRQRFSADPAALRRHPAGCIHFVPVTQLAISATQIRAAIAAGASPRYLLPDSVWRAIRELGLYRAPG